MSAYRSHDVLAWPSTYEGFGMVLVEAMSQQLPVVATPVGCATTLVVDGVTGRRVPARDSTALAGALERLLGDAPLRARLSAAALRAVETMSWSETARQTLACYDRARRSVRRAA
jgi:glycosyltransferase involved in cell wall biosynthesis